MLDFCTIDVGNSFMKIALWESNTIDTVIYFPIAAEERWSQYLHQKIDCPGIISSVSIDPQKILDALISMNLWMVLDSDTPLTFQTNYDSRKSIGKDRIAAMAGAISIYPNEDLVVFDLGTCLTTDYIKSGKRHLGGNISPGWYMRLEAMNAFTSRLPLPEQEYNEHFIGNSTSEALQNGAFYGLLWEMELAIEQFSSNATAIITGGDSVLFAEKMKRKIFVHPNLVHQGLHEIYKHNI